MSIVSGSAATVGSLAGFLKESISDPSVCLPLARSNVSDVIAHFRLAMEIQALKAENIRLQRKAEKAELHAQAKKQVSPLSEKEILDIENSLRS